MALRSWISAARLRTLPLASAGVLMGYYLAREISVVDLFLFALILTTAIGLQILANFANDYGDFKKGTDNDDRLGPTRQLQSGAITMESMRLGLIITAISVFVLGLWTVIRSVQDPVYFGLFILLGLVSIWAAFRYTTGKNAYGYRALGDVFVFIFFGLVAVLGSAYLLSGGIEPRWIYPAIYVGLGSVGVLNLNNMRDIDNDRRMGKITLAGIFGLEGGKFYQTLLTIVGWGSLLYYDMSRGNDSLLIWDGLIGLGFVFILFLMWTRKGVALNPLLKYQSLLIFLSVLLRF